MRILITGASGFLGQLLAKALLNEPSHTLILTDLNLPPIPKGVAHPQNAHCIQADLTSESSIARLLSPAPDAIYIFHGIMSAGSEANFDLGMRANFDATRALLEGCRAARPGIRIIYASSQAVYGQPLPAVVDESVRATPQSSYGAAKLMCETLVSEFSRRGFVDGLSLRFPTVVVRPGAPSAAASSFLSGMIREPLNGQECVVPLRDRSFGSWVCSPRSLLGNLLYALILDTSLMESHEKVVNMPGRYVTIAQVRDVLAKVGGEDLLRFLKEETDPEIEAILRTWAERFDNAHACRLGFQPDWSFESAVMDYKESLESGS